MANKKTEITTQFQADITGLKKGIAEAQRQIRIANAEFKAAASGMDDWRKSSEGLQAKIKQLSTVLSTQKEILRKYEEELKLVEKDGGKGTKQADDLRVAIANQQAAINKTSRELNGYETELNQLGQSENNAEKEAHELDNAIRQSGDGFTVFKGVLSNLVSTAIRATIDGLVQLGKTAITTGKSFESAMSEVQAISGASNEELQMLSKTARDFGASTVFSASEAADALKYMSLAGWDAQTSASALGGVLNLAAASGMELGMASDMVTDYLTAFGMSAKESTYFADLLAYAQSNANTTAEQLGEAYKNSAALLHASGQDVETVTALLASMANQGLKGSEAGTALAAVMRDITKAMDNGSISIGDTLVTVQDANGNFRDMTDILMDVQAATEGMGDAQKMTALQSTFTAKSLKGISLLLNDSVKNTAKFESALRSAAGTARDMSDVMTDNLEGDLTRLNSHFEDVQISIYNEVEPAVRELVSSLDDLIDDGGDLAKKILPQLASGFTWLVQNLDGVIAGITALAVGYGTFKAVTVGATLAQEALNFVMSLNPYVLVATAIAAVIGGLTMYMATADFAIDKTAALNSEQKALVEETGKLNDAIRESADTRADDMANIDAQKTLVGKLVAELKSYTNAEGKVVKEQARAKEIIDELNSIMPELNLSYNEQTQMLSMSTAELERNTEALWEQARAAAAQEQMTSIMQERIEVETQMIRMEEEFTNAQNSLIEANQKRKEAEAALNAALAEGADKNLELSDAAAAAREEYERVAEWAEPIISAYGSLQVASEDLDEEQEILTEILGGTTSAMQQQGEATGALADEVGGATEEMTGKWDELHKAVAESVQGQINIFDEYKQATAHSKDDILKNMQDQVDGLKSWSDDLQALSKRGVSEGLLTELSKMGPEGAGYVHSFVEMSNEELQKANELFDQAAIIPETTAAAVEENYSKLGEYRWECLQKGSRAGSQKVKPEMEKDTAETGKYAAEGLAKGVKMGTPEVETEFDSTAKAALRAMNNGLGVQSPSKLTMQSGMYVAEGLRIGIKNGVPVVRQAATELANSVLKVVDSIIRKDAYVAIGARIGEGLAEGILSRLDSIKAAASKAAEAAKEATKEKLEIHSPSRVFKYLGEMSGAGYVEGLKASFADSEIGQTMRGVVDAVRANVSGLRGAVTGETPATNNTVNNYSFVQNNTSPKALNRLDIYRQTQNQLRYARML